MKEIARIWILSKLSGLQEFDPEMLSFGILHCLISPTFSEKIGLEFYKFAPAELELEFAVRFSPELI